MGFLKFFGKNLFWGFWIFYLKNADPLIWLKKNFKGPIRCFFPKILQTKNFWPPTLLAKTPRTYCPFFINWQNFWGVDFPPGPKITLFQNIFGVFWTFFGKNPFGPNRGLFNFFKIKSLAPVEKPFLIIAKIGSFKFSPSKMLCKIFFILKIPPGKNWFSPRNPQIKKIFLGGFHPVKNIFLLKFKMENWVKALKSRSCF